MPHNIGGNKSKMDSLSWKANSGWVQSFDDEELSAGGDDKDNTTVPSNNSSLKNGRANPSVPNPRRLLSLIDKRRYIEAAQLVSKFDRKKVIGLLADLPLLRLVKEIPNTLSTIEVILTKIFLDTGQPSSQQINGEAIPLLKIVLHIVKFIASQEDPKGIKSDFLHQYTNSCEKILRIINNVKPGLDVTLDRKVKIMIQSIEAMGEHGLVEYNSEQINIYDAIRRELDWQITQYKLALQKLDDLSLVSSSLSKPQSLNSSKAPFSFSHQRMMAYNQVEIQERLYKNKLMFNTLRPPDTRVNDLPKLVATLDRRINADKDNLLVFTQLRKEMEIDGMTPVASALLIHCNAMKKVITVMEGETDKTLMQLLELSKDPTTNQSGFHKSVGKIEGKRSTRRASWQKRTDMKKRSRSLSPAALRIEEPKQLKTNGTTIHDCSFSYVLPQEAKNTDAINTGTDDIDLSNVKNSVLDNDMSELRGRVTFSSQVIEIEPSLCSHITEDDAEKLRTELRKSSAKVVLLQQREMELIDRLSDQAKRNVDNCGRFEDLQQSPDQRPTELIKRYNNLYSEGRIDALDALDTLPQLSDLEGADELKQKILFSVIVLSFRSVLKSIQEMKSQIQVILTAPLIGKRNDQLPIDDIIMSHLRSTSKWRDVSANIKDVTDQLWSTLHQYPEIQQCEPLQLYIKDCVKLAWLLLTQNPPYIIDFQAVDFKPDIHVRFHTSDSATSKIISHVWPSLHETPGGPCVAKGVVST